MVEYSEFGLQVKDDRSRDDYTIFKIINEQLFRRFSLDYEKYTNGTRAQATYPEGYSVAIKNVLLKEYIKHYTVIERPNKLAKLLGLI